MDSTSSVVDGKQDMPEFPKGIPTGLNPQLGVTEYRTYTVSDPQAKRPPLRGTVFPNTQEFPTIPKMFDATVQRHPQAVAYKFKADGEWKSVSYIQMQEEAHSVARALIGLGLQPGESIGIQGFVHPRWSLAALAAYKIQGMLVPMYFTLKAADTDKVVKLTQPKVVVLEGDRQLAKYIDGEEELNPEIQHYVSYAAVGEAAKKVLGDKVLSWEEFLARGEEVNIEEVHGRSNSIQAEDTALIMPTSGTTGDPKGVMHSHSALTYGALTGAEYFGITHVDRTLGYLPLAHIAGSMLYNYLPWACGAEVDYAGVDALISVGGQPPQLTTYTAETHPTVMFGVPEVWASVVEKTAERIAGASFIKRGLANWALRITQRADQARIDGTRVPSFRARIADKLVISKLKAALGFDAVRIAAAGAGPLSQETIEGMQARGLRLVNVYGMTECAGLGSSYRPQDPRFGTVGSPFPGVEFGLAEADESGRTELLIRGPGVMKGYLGKPEKNLDDVMPNGWLRTGDYAMRNEDGSYTVTGRKKELFKVKGHYVAPLPIESRLGKIPGVANGIVFGDQREFITAGVTLPTVVNAAGVPSGDLTEEAIAVFALLGSNARTVEEAKADDKIRAYLDQQVQRVNEDAPDAAARLKGVIILDRDFNIEDGTLTANKKLRRHMVAQLYADRIEQMYEDLGEQPKAKPPVKDEGAAKTPPAEDMEEVEVEGEK